MNAAHQRMAGRASGRAREWSAEKIARCRELAESDWTAPAIARELGIVETTVWDGARRNGIHIRSIAERTAAGDAVLRQHYPTAMPIDDILPLYRAARGDQATRAALQARSSSLGLKRPPPGFEQVRAAQASRVANLQAAWVRDAVRVRELLAAGATYREVTRQTGYSAERLTKMRKAGLIPPPPPPVPPAPKPKVAKPKPIRVVRVVRAVAPPPPPPKPKPTYQTVEAWLAAGNAITRCPAAMVVECQATIPEADKAAMVALYAERERVRPKGKHGAAMKATTRQRAINYGWFV